jgi:hypothetical protein
LRVVVEEFHSWRSLPYSPFFRSLPAELFLALPQEWRAKPFWVEGAGHNNIEAMLRPTGMFIAKLVEFLELHVAARRGTVAKPRAVPECVPLAIREIEAAAGQWR